MSKNRMILKWLMPTWFLLSSRLSSSTTTEMSLTRGKLKF